ncbi:DUF421 domain-containing protein [Clostridium aminobutyricum]|uniref:DUF421 domain-containing protein n=1 Tax=Clostridium aminobutyricum TaxID=33953 RepID=A0A939DAJ8_CLOAM|nr:DUF421 domain-containing protein [Clostridium aminobutyricum]MBN7774155.1 DUF421 domain-containing protein [Clostridium aminobutyricum]
MSIILIRTAILYLLVLLALRIMGKSELSKLSPFQIVVLFMVAELATLSIEDTNLSVISGVSAIFTVIFLEIFLSYLSLKFEWFKNLINGKPTIIIEDGKINEDELKKLRININDLFEQLRLKNAPSLSDVSYAVMESNGDLSVITKPEKRPLTPSDMGIIKSKEVMPLIVICDGALYPSSLERLGWNEDYLHSLLDPLNIFSFKDVLLAFSDEQKTLHVYEASQDGKIAVEVVV